MTTTDPRAIAAEARANKIRAMLADGHSPATIHREFGVTRNALLKWCNEHDPELRTLLRPGLKAADIPCTVTGCDRPQQSRGLCNACYSAARKAGMALLHAASPVPDFPDAACVGMGEQWFPEDASEARFAAKVCARCPHLEPCRDLAAGEDWGVYGGIWVTPDATRDLIPPKTNEQEVAA